MVGRPGRGRRTSACARGMLPAQTAGRSCRKPSGFLDPPAPLTGLPARTIYPIIARLERYGWLESRWEDPTAWPWRPPAGLREAPLSLGTERHAAPSRGRWRDGTA